MSAALHWPPRSCQAYLNARGEVVDPAEQDGIGCPVCRPPAGRVPRANEVWRIEVENRLGEKVAEWSVRASSFDEALEGVEVPAGFGGAEWAPNVIVLRPFEAGRGEESHAEVQH